MKSLTEFTKAGQDRLYYESLAENIIIEKLSEPHLIELAGYLKDMRTTRGDKDAIKDPWYYGNPNSFASIFRTAHVQWDKVTESDFMKYPAGDKKGTTEAKRFLKNGTGYKPVVVIWTKDDKIVYASNGVTVISINRGSVSSVWDVDSHEYVDAPMKPTRMDKVKQMDIADLCAKYDFMILDTSDPKLSSQVMKGERSSRQAGVISPDMYERIAKDNRDRYKKIIAQNKAEALAKNDTISIEVDRVLSEVMSVSTKVMRGGAKYADLEYDMSSLINLVNSHTSWDSKGARTVGSNGLLELYKDYITTNMSAARSSGYYSSFNSDASKLKPAIEKKIQAIDAKLKTIYEKL